MSKALLTAASKTGIQLFIVLSTFLFLAACQENSEVLQGVSAAPPNPPPARPGVPPQPKSPHPTPSPPHGPSGAAVPFMQKLQGFKDRLAKDPKDVEALIFLANSNFDIQRYEKAQELYLRVLDIDPDNLHVRTDLASAYRNLGNAHQAVVALRMVLDRNPNHEVALYNLGIILLQDQNDQQGAAEAWERLVRLNPKDPLADALREKIQAIRSGTLQEAPQE